MEGKVITVIFKQHKIRKAVIRNITVYMVNFFGRQKKSTQMFFHYKTVFSNISSTSSKGMVGFTNKNISSTSFNSAFFVLKNIGITFGRTILGFVKSTKPIWIYKKLLLASFTRKLLSTIYSLFRTYGSAHSYNIAEMFKMSRQ